MEEVNQKSLRGKLPGSNDISVKGLIVEETIELAVRQKQGEFTNV
jgi:hypothetical protein